MSQSTKPWTGKELVTAKRILAKYTNLALALPEIQRRVRPVTKAGLRHNIPGAARYLRQPTVDDMHQEHTKRALESQLRADNKALLKELAGLRRQQEIALAISKATVAPVKVRDLKKHPREGAAVLLASDWHTEEIVLAGSTPTGNAYSRAIAERRIERFFAASRWMIDFHRPVFGCKDVVLWVGGDMITGSIHDDPVRGAGPASAVYWVEQRLVDGIQYLLEDSDIKRLHVVCSYGNHGRTTLKPRRASGADNSWEWLMYQHLGERIAGPRVTFDASPTAHQYLKLYGYNLHFHHGDEVSYYGGSGGISIPLLKAVAQWDKWRFADYHNFGHFHQHLDLGQIAVNGSLIGCAPYGMSIKATPEPPQQSFFIVDSKRGKTCRSPLWVSE